MKVGLVSFWFNRGQATLGRHLRSALEGLGHETFVLARPTRERFVRPAHIEERGVWAQPGVTPASSYEIPAIEYREWAQRNGLDAIFFFQNYQFAAIADLRKRGVVTFGCFMWESMRAQDVAGATEAYDVVYSLNHCSHERYLAWGLNSLYLGWGCHPELLAYRAAADDARTTFLFPGGYMRPRRKLLRPVLEAFAALEDPDARLVVKAQNLPPREESIQDLVRADPRVQLIVGDPSLEDYHRLFSSCQVLVAPSGWEGLGLHLYEALAFGMPVVTNDAPPMNELVTDGYNGRLVASIPAGQAKTGIAAMEVDAAEITPALRDLCRPARSERMARGALERAQGEFAWERVIERLEDVLQAGMVARA
jgi:glycosyltransferase involved in cell wall biosynthesis